MSERPIRVGIAGAGLIGQVHAAALRQLPEAEIVAVADPMPGKAAAFAPAHAPGAATFEDIAAMLERGGVEAVCVCTPHPQHADVVVACAERGVHAIVEKPFTVTLADADRAIAAARRHGTRLGVVFQRRWYPAARRLRAAIDDGRLGRPIVGEAIVEFWRGGLPLGRAFWVWGLLGGGVVSLCATLLALMLLAARAPGWLAALVFGAHIPWNLVLLVGVWRSAARPEVSHATANVARLAMIVWVVALSLL